MRCHKGIFCETEVDSLALQSVTATINYVLRFAVSVLGETKSSLRFHRVPCESEVDSHLLFALVRNTCAGLAPK